MVTLMLACASVLPAAAQERPAPASRARAAIVVDAETGAVLYERDARTPLAPASLTKMATALVAVERAPLDRPVRPSHAYNVTPVVIGLEPGDSLALGDALYGLLLNSGNDAALAIAETAGDGSTERFVGWMNDLARRLGLEHTTFKNPHGLDQDGHLSSAYDMAIIGRTLMRQPALREVVGHGRYVVEGPPRWVFRSTNPLLGTYEGVDGIKTGFDDNAGRCLVATAERDGRRAIAVVMNSPAYGDEAAALLDYAFADERWGRRGGAADGPAVRQRAQSPSAARISMLRADLGVDGAPASLGQAGRLALTATAQRTSP
ncbi:MAG: D-alanyl-D-alanine carboxypeptidase [Chloroflexi bacterium]|nr:D-alanyl-D-alanine carboxypeptidase [Chloroflexota bacterium]